MSNETIDLVTDTTHDKYVHTQLYILELSPAKVIDELKEKGVDFHSARYIVDRVGKQVLREKAKKDILYGSLIIGAGAFFVISFIALNMRGRIILYSFAAFIYGAFRLIRGLVNLAKSRRQPDFL